MNTRERVAEAMRNDTFCDDLHLQGTTQHDARCEHYAAIALDDVCEGLGWQGAGENSLSYHGRQIGMVQSWVTGEWQVFFMGDFHKVGTRDHARAALLSAARSWIRGES